MEFIGCRLDGGSCLPTFNSSIRLLYSRKILWLNHNPMTHYDTIELTVNDRIATLWLNRPDVRNAFNDVMIAELIDCLAAVGQDKDIIALVLRGRGKVFCGGADIQWMQSFSQRSYEEDYQGNQQLAQCFYAFYNLPQPTMAVVHGAAFGGANGLLAACDMAYCVENTTFAFSEVKIGIHSRHHRSLRHPTGGPIIRA